MASYEEELAEASAALLDIETADSRHRNRDSNMSGWKYN